MPTFDLQTELVLRMVQKALSSMNHLITHGLEEQVKAEEENVLVTLFPSGGGRVLTCTILPDSPDTFCLLAQAADTQNVWLKVQDSNGEGHRRRLIHREGDDIRVPQLRLSDGRQSLLLTDRDGHPLFPDLV